MLVGRWKGEEEGGFGGGGGGGEGGEINVVVGLMGRERG